MLASVGRLRIHIKSNLTAVGSRDGQVPCELVWFIWQSSGSVRDHISNKRWKGPEELHLRLSSDLQRYKHMCTCYTHTHMHRERNTTYIHTHTHTYDIYTHPPLWVFVQCKNPGHEASGSDRGRGNLIVTELQDQHHTLHC